VVGPYKRSCTSFATTCCRFCSASRAFFSAEISGGAFLFRCVLIPTKVFSVGCCAQAKALTLPTVLVFGRRHGIPMGPWIKADAAAWMGLVMRARPLREDPPYTATVNMTQKIALPQNSMRHAALCTETGRCETRLRLRYRLWKFDCQINRLSGNQIVRNPGKRWHGGQSLPVSERHCSDK
jgi:hypothetical protein